MCSAFWSSCVLQFTLDAHFDLQPASGHSSSMQFVAKTRYSYISCESCGNARLPAARNVAVAPPASSNDASSGNQHQRSAHAAPAATAAPVAAVAAVPSSSAASREEGPTIFAGEAMCPVHVQLVYRYTPTGTGESLT